MTDSVTDASTSDGERIAPVWLILVCVGALTVYLLMLRSWQVPDSDGNAATAGGDTPAQLEMSRRLTQPGMGATKSTIKPAARSLLVPLAGFTLAMGAGICLGLWWPSHVARRKGADTEDEKTLHTFSDEPTVPFTPLQKHSALVEEEHIVGAQSTTVTDEAEAPEAPRKPEADAADTAQHDDTLDNILASNIVDAQPVDEPARDDTDNDALQSALAAKDQVIESLEDIVKENRDRWSDFEAQRDEFNNKIDKLEAELRIANFIIEGARGAGEDEPLERPQILTRV